MKAWLQACYNVGQDYLYRKSWIKLIDSVRVIFSYFVVLYPSYDIHI